MTTGNIASVRDRSTGRLVLDIQDAGGPVIDPGGYDHRFSASIRGWHRGHNVGTGPTRDEAVADLARQCGVRVDELLEQTADESSSYTGDQP